LEDIDERKIDLGYRLVEPVFFEKFGIFGMPNKREMGVQDETVVTDGHRVAVARGRWL
jgi:hypothetical protein